MSTKTPANPAFKEFENDSHLARKQKAVSNEFKKKNSKQIIDMITSEAEDDDENDFQKYVRYIK